MAVMHSLILLAVVACDAQAHAKEAAVTYMGDAHDELVGVMFQRKSKALALPSTDLDDTTLGKTSQLAIHGGPGRHSSITSPAAHTRAHGAAQHWRSSTGRRAISAKAEGDGIAERIAKFVFGEKVLEEREPAGLKRMTVEEWPDQWPPVTDVFADPVDGDSPEVAKFRPLLKQTKLERKQMALLYDAEKDGWSEAAFHSKVDGMGGCVLIAESEEGTVFGGYNPQGWLGYGDWRDAISAFLFCWPMGAGMGKGQEATKLPKCGGSGMAIIDEPGKGPQWGPDGLKIVISGRSAASRLGSYYERMPGGGRTLFGDEGNSVTLKGLRVYTGLGETEKEKNYKPNLFQYQPGELERIRKNDPDAKG
eukprot:gnl/TRDRNA2_/TRDRNA2_199682_c0_seq1.p1 gnl/TRDRNA2_/TRDRNA2_199682_c0~~gnl/TRDRNA2_/TRDRNA2_199682_c0_seq1.p1  ORF type:complete len:364 (+),score=72.89 gnl/TRDRNA2_/TRDRNA2_199682_c0_seq1:65-1156(+)